ncbi:hypothetical protein LOC71_18870 [Rhodopirellula sp. JC740]|uniref:Uncharacterized protein n=1 Tax=Rhodopirellula halodulae TaxID=2894198 RepID=A0ABS8NLB7_9BACT|nr:hypothetical protein [Rhodopirellula sp. JC740]MCC9644345.1 hypothetical protein [Rhodopirellula sp. JC740]
MIVHAIKIVAYLSVVACIGLAVYCGANGIRSVEDIHNFRVMRSVPDPVVVALADGSLAVGSTTKELLAVDTPAWTEDYGRCKIHGFTPERSYDRQTIVTVDGRIVSAHVGSCTWSWTFFDEMPEDVAEAVGSVRGLRYAIDLVPEHAAILQPLLDEQLASLGVQAAAGAGKAEP